MKLVLLILAFCFVAQTGQAQWNVSYHQSKLPMIGVGYEWTKWTTELRFMVDSELENLTPELVGTYKFVSKELFYAEAGLGARYGELYSGMVIPVGLHIYPFQSKQVGFHMEIAGIVGDDQIIRGSWGINFRFK